MGNAKNNITLAKINIIILYIFKNSIDIFAKNI
ncbi:Uncharacterised protein [Clostridioides difficile]|nr:Uncharacterised protein [Clostridioides difficile]